jgi:alpha-tubulin suppressor-like RCC1 family protein
VWAWGAGDAGELGNGAFDNSEAPVKVSGLSNITAIAGGGGNGYALRSDGTVWAWGNGIVGELGNGQTPEHSAVPVQVSKLSQVTAISGGGADAYALRSDGTVWAWGDNSEGALGNGTTDDSAVPVQVSGLTHVTAISSGPIGNNAFALRSDGTVWAWGDGQYGALGDGKGIPHNDCTCSPTPVQVAGLSGISAITGEYENGYALSRDGSVWAWGADDDDALLDGKNAISDIPVHIAGLGKITKLVSSDGTTVALRSDGTVWTWGSSVNGTLGNGSEDPTGKPVQVLGLSEVTIVGDGAAVIP